MYRLPANAHVSSTTTQFNTPGSLQQHSAMPYPVFPQPLKQMGPQAGTYPAVSAACYTGYTTCSTSIPSSMCYPPNTGSAPISRNLYAPGTPWPPQSQPEPLAPSRGKRTMPNPPRPAARGSGGLDICFVMDCTGSMQPWIEASKQTIKDMIQALPAEEKHKRVAFVGYRDFDDGPAEIQGFTEQTEDVIRFINGQNAFGGGDIAEDVAGGIAAALSQDWASQTRTLVLIADAPCHGTKYQPSNLSDDYPQGDPTGLSMTLLLQACRSSGIDFTFVQLTSETDVMQRRLQQVYEAAAGPENINKFELRDLRHIIEEAGGMAALGEGRGEHVSVMLSSAVTPTIQSSYQTQQTGRQFYSAPVAATYAQYSASQPQPQPQPKYHTHPRP